jgi:hypothetical protein
MIVPAMSSPSVPVHSGAPVGICGALPPRVLHYMSLVKWGGVRVPHRLASSNPQSKCDIHRYGSPSSAQSATRQRAA